MRRVRACASLADENASGNSNSNARKRSRPQEAGENSRGKRRKTAASKPQTRLAKAAASRAPQPSPPAPLPALLKAASPDPSQPVLAEWGLEALLRLGSATPQRRLGNTTAALLAEATPLLPSSLRGPPLPTSVSITFNASRLPLTQLFAETTELDSTQLATLGASLAASDTQKLASAADSGQPVSAGPLLRSARRLKLEQQQDVVAPVAAAQPQEGSGTPAAALTKRPQAAAAPASAPSKLPASALPAIAPSKHPAGGRAPQAAAQQKPPSSAPAKQARPSPARSSRSTPGGKRSPAVRSTSRTRRTAPHNSDFVYPEDKKESRKRVHRRIRALQDEAGGGR